MIDILSKETIWKLIGEEKDKGTAVLIASHDIPEIKRLCSSFVVMKNGEIVFRGKPMDLKSDFCRCKITVASIQSTMKALLEAGGNFLQNGSEFEIITDDIAQMLLLMQDVAGASEDVYKRQGIHNGLKIRRGNLASSNLASRTTSEQAMVRSLRFFTKIRARPRRCSSFSANVHARALLPDVQHPLIITHSCFPPRFAANGNMVHPMKIAG